MRSCVSWAAGILMLLLGTLDVFAYNKSNLSFLMRSPLCGGAVGAYSEYVILDLTQLIFSGYISG